MSLDELRGSELVSLANRIVPFPLACREIGMDNVPEPRQSGSRAYCPFGEFSHPDGGRDQALRVYYDHGFCFAEWLYLTPVRILVLAQDLAEEEAARHLLDRIGYHPASWQERWEELLEERLEPDYSALARALRSRMEVRYPDWGNRQLDSNVSTKLASCLGLLTRVHSEADCKLWLEWSSEVMAQALGG